jgi:hypothetical protein
MPEPRAGKAGLVSGDQYAWWPGGAPTPSEIEWANRLLDLIDDFDHRARFSQWELDLAAKIAIIAKRRASLSEGDDA